MAKEFSRSQRVGDQIQKSLASIIQTPVRDAGLGFVTISAVKVSTDLSHAKIFVTCLGDHLSGQIDESETDNESVLTMLNDDAPKFRHLLSKELTTRIVPKLEFLFDESLQQANRLTDLIDSLNSEDSKDQ